MSDSTADQTTRTDTVVFLSHFVTALVFLWRAQVGSGNQAGGRVCADSITFFGTSGPTDLMREAYLGSFDKSNSTSPVPSVW